MTSLKDQIQQEIRKERGGSEKPRETGSGPTGDPGKRLDEIRPRLDELPHTTDQYSLRVGYAKGQYSADIAIVELYDLEGAWVAMWQIAETVGGSLAEWEVTYNPRGVDTQHKWFRDSDSLFEYLTASIAERVIEMASDSD